MSRALYSASLILINVARVRASQSIRIDQPDVECSNHGLSSATAGAAVCQHDGDFWRGDDCGVRYGQPPEVRLARGRMAGLQCTTLLNYLLISQLHNV